MPELGDTISACELGYKNRRRYTWMACVDCGKERWAQTNLRCEPINARCNPCARRRPSIKELGGTLNEPEIGEIRKGKEVGDGKCTGPCIWCACESCGKERWVQLHKGVPRNKGNLCTSCNAKIELSKCNKLYGSKNPNWKEGKMKVAQGYILFGLRPNDFFYPMANKGGYVPEHRLVIAKHLGRCLHPWEIIHHINGIKDDNRLENLQLVSDLGHKQLTMLEAKIDKLFGQNQELKQEIRLLRLQMSQLTGADIGK